MMNVRVHHPFSLLVLSGDSIRLTGARDRCDVTKKVTNPQATFTPARCSSGQNLLNPSLFFIDI